MSSKKIYTTFCHQLHLHVILQCIYLHTDTRPPLGPVCWCRHGEYAPVHLVPRCSLAERVNHLTAVGLAVRRWRLAPVWSEVLGLRCWKWKYVFLFMQGIQLFYLFFSSMLWKLLAFLSNLADCISLGCFLYVFFKHL